MAVQDHLAALLERRLPPASREWLAAARAEIAGGVDNDVGKNDEVNNDRFCALFSLASRFTPRRALEPNAQEIAEAANVLSGWNPERWTLLEAVRVALILARVDLADRSGAQAVEELFRYADAGELCAAYRSLAHLPMPERFVWRAGEGARSSMKSVYEAACCDTPYAAKYFDAVAWRSAVIKALFVEAPLWRLPGLDARLDEELARMALDLTDERRSAARPVNPDTWLCLGRFGGKRALESIERELATGSPQGRAGAAFAFARAGQRERLLSLSAVEKDALVHRAMATALGGKHDQAAYGALTSAGQGAR